MSTQAKTESHDLAVPPELARFMTTGWAETSPVETVPSEAAAHAARRRAALAESFPGERLVIPAGRVTARNGSHSYRFRPDSSYVYLTGDQQPEGVLVIEAGIGETLYLPPTLRRDSESTDFFSNRQRGELWVGPGPTMEQSAELLGIRCLPLDRLEEAVRDGSARVLRGVNVLVDGLVDPDPAKDAEFAAVISELRLVKDAWEIERIQEAVDHTIRGFEDAVRSLPAAVDHHRGERWIEGVFNLRARAEGNDVGYRTIAAAGSHACVLHWNRNSGAISMDQLLLLDAGVEHDLLYTADITRTMPVSSRYTGVQREVYELVWKAQRAAIATVRPGARFRDYHLAAMWVISEGLAEWGVLAVTPEEAMETELYRRYTLCGSGHMLGMDCHDCARARSDAYPDGVLEAGHVLTVEPGLYLQPDDLTLPPELRGIGVRIEDDLVVTPDGNRNLSAALPSRPDEVESWMADLLR